MGRTIVLRIVEAGAIVVADVLDAEAPKTARLIWDALPLDGLLHLFP